MAKITHPGQTILDAEWQYAEVEAGQFADASVLPSELNALIWKAAQVPGTVASAQREAKEFAYGATNYDDYDYWFRCECSSSQAASLRFDGLASLVDVYWNDALLFSADNMFRQYRVDMQAHQSGGTNGVISLRFKSVNATLKIRRPRARWRTKLVEQQQLRWLRTSLLGRIPGWSPPVAPVGPYRPVVIEAASVVQIIHADIRSSVRDGDGIVNATIEINTSVSVDSATLAISLCVGDQRLALTLAKKENEMHQLLAQGEMQIAQAQLWWPHTHGNPAWTPALYPAHIEVTIGTQQYLFDLGKLGFRTIEVRQNDGDFHLYVNGVSVFCRGACWTPVDLISLAGDASDLLPTLTLARDAGMNMLRVGGTMLYESDDFYRLCDELGLLVWQDFMFANMDYPVDDPAFAENIRQEATQFLDRTQLSPCIAVLCGSSEIEQQAAMLGVAPNLWRNHFFAENLPQLCKAMRPDATYIASSPSGGVMPFQLDAGVAHYFGVGAYLRPLEDARRAGLRFTSECLGFSNMPDDSTIEALLKNGEAPGTHPVWKQRVPRDSGTGWDFEDVRDHYMAQLFQLDPAHLRYADPTRYLALARVTTGEVMVQTLAEWRRGGSSCHGALIWFLRDLWLGAGWGLIDAIGKPKAAYYYAKRAMAPLSLLMTDEGLNGLALHLVNDSAVAYQGTLSLDLYRHGETRIAQGQLQIDLAPHSVMQVRADSMLEHFFDTTYAYRFGPPGHNVAVARFQTAPSSAHCEAFYFPLGIGQLSNPVERDLGLQAHFVQTDDDHVMLHVSTRKLALSLAIEVIGYQPEDNFFHLAPGTERHIRLTRLTHLSKNDITQKNLASADKIQGTVTALNAISPCKIMNASLVTSANASANANDRDAGNRLESSIT